MIEGLPAEELEEWTRLAEGVGITLTEFIRRSVNHAKELATALAFVALIPEASVHLKRVDVFELIGRPRAQQQISGRDYCERLAREFEEKWSEG